MRDLRIKVRAIILSITGFISVFLVIRILLDLIEASSTNSFVKLIHNLSQFFIDPFAGIIKNNDPELHALNVDAIVAMVIIIFLGILISEIATAFLYERAEDIIQNIIDTCFKLVEFVLGLRLILDFFKIETSNKFITNVNALTDWSKGITDASLFDQRIYVSTLVMLVIVVLLDIFTESLLNSLFREIRKQRKTKVTTYTTSQQPIHQTINVHVPAQSQNVVPVAVPMQVPHNQTNNYPRGVYIPPK